MKAHAQRSEHVFLVRTWWERDSTGARQRRGSAEHVASGVRIYFAALRDMDDFIEQWSKEPVPAPEE